MFESVFATVLPSKAMTRLPRLICAPTQSSIFMGAEAWCEYDKKRTKPRFPLAVGDQRAAIQESLTATSKNNATNFALMK